MVWEQTKHQARLEELRRNSDSQQNSISKSDADFRAEIDALVCVILSNPTSSTPRINHLDGLQKAECEAKQAEFASSDFIGQRKTLETQRQELRKQLEANAYACSCLHTQALQPVRHIDFNH